MIIFSSEQSTMAALHQERKPPQDSTEKGKDSIEWVYMWEELITREEKLERMITAELQRRLLFALQDKKYLKPGISHLCSFDPFKVTDIRTMKGGFSKVDVLVSVHRVIDNEIDKKTEKYITTFRPDYDLGFVVTECKKIAEENVDGK